MLEITAIPALQDNYIWAIHNDTHVALVDPGEAAPALEFLQTRGLKLEAILCTHRHHDHIGGIAKLRGVYNVPVYGRRHPGSQRIAANPHITRDLRESDRLRLESLTIDFDILEIPGHLEDHIAFVAPETFPTMLFCGDVMFGAGCGRNFEGTLAQLHESLQRLARLPEDTRVYCSHEYTASNLRFALACEPDNPVILRRIEATRQLRDAGLPSLPSTIALEKTTNPFLRCSEPEIVRTLQIQGLADTSELGVFTALRNWRNHF
ncbi:MAG: hydroxyacylglutathione hydrolase [Gallionellales bacterium GWA2_59_43]|nr:MAG: hydroxyacylglutathione hydrolase [Gallionellales bacterium GWA2_59_43]